MTSMQMYYPSNTNQSGNGQQILIRAGLKCWRITLKVSKCLNTLQNHERQLHYSTHHLEYWGINRSGARARVSHCWGYPRHRRWRLSSMECSSSWLSLPTEFLWTWSQDVTSKLWPSPPSARSNVRRRPWRWRHLPPATSASRTTCPWHVRMWPL